LRLRALDLYQSCCHHGDVVTSKGMSVTDCQN